MTILFRFYQLALELELEAYPTLVNQHTRRRHKYYGVPPFHPSKTPHWITHKIIRVTTKY